MMPQLLEDEEFGEFKGLSEQFTQRIFGPAQGDPYHGHPLRQRLPAHQGQRLPHST